ncbi:hypothetical protein QZH41_005121 [Actinostola sp. cb2023]|nr:hypothetical protein QZH41_005121 [Actinostola sp. cb2023]
MLREPDLTLDGILTLARSMEASDHQANEIEGKQVSTPVLAVQQSSRQRSQHRVSQANQGNEHDKCFCCGIEGHRPKDPECPVKGKTCNNCQKPGHFARVCRSEKQNNSRRRSAPSTEGIRYVGTDTKQESSDDEYLFTMHTSNRKTVPVNIEGIEIPMIIDSGAIAVPKSNGEVRVCVDMRRVNEAVIRERHPIPTLEETLQSLNGAAVFSKLDLRWGYHQVELHPESRALTTFSTHNGLKRYKRLIFGLSSAPETYQYVMQSTLQGIVGVRNISDDIIVFGKTQEEHDRSLEQTLQRLQDSGLTLNKEKCVFSVSELVFFGFKVSAAGLSPDQKTIDAVKEARAPTNAAEVRSFNFLDWSITAHVLFLSLPLCRSLCDSLHGNMLSGPGVK